jgi:hypothetical protein
MLPSASEVLLYVQIVAGFATLGGFYSTYKVFQRTGKPRK